MCSIAGHIGKKEGLETVLESLKRMEYRGYDSAGVLFFQNGKPVLVKKRGKLANLEAALASKKSQNNFPVAGHTRWATHGIPNETNAHPHQDCHKKIFLVHNGIIENYQELKNKLIENGHRFLSDTDTEVVAHLVEGFLDKKNYSFEEAVRLSLKSIIGTYALVVINKNDPDKLIVARNSSPLLV